MKGTISRINNVKYKDVKNLKEILSYLRVNKPDIIISDDYFPKLRITTKIKHELNIRTCIYVQILFGSHIIADVFNATCLSIKERMLYRILKHAFFYMLKSWYRRLLMEHDVILSNSDITATFLSIIYDIECHNIVYPPLDTNIFRVMSKNKSNQVLLYVGSCWDDTDDAFLNKLCVTLQNKKFKILILGNRILHPELLHEPNVQQLCNITDEELAQFYSESVLTICPQKWETFGYVVAESIFCGTPVLTFNSMGSAEIVTKTNAGYLANNKKDFLTELEQFNIKERINKKNLYFYDMSYSATKLVTAIEASDN